MAYQYDQLNRLNSSESYEPTINNLLQRTGNERYDATYSYDKLGNIKYLTRKGSVGQLIDNFEYNYTYATDTNDLVNNQLQSVIDSEGDQGEGDLGVQQLTNYDYDAIGQLTKDEQANIQSIEWTAPGKVKKITFDPNHFAGVERMYFVYDGMDNRVQKIVDKTDQRITTHYVRDASGNILSTYNTLSSPQNALDTIEMVSHSTRQVKTEQHHYGSNRLGVDNYSIVDTLTYNSDFTLANEYTVVNTISSPVLEFLPVTRPPRPKYSNHVVDKVQYEVSNHLGNVLSTFSDLKLGLDSDSDMIVDNYEGLVKTANDYYGFGMSMFNRNINNKYKFLFNGMEKEDIHNNDYYSTYYRLYSNKVGRWITPDPIEFAEFSTYVGIGNNPILFVDKLGDKIAYPDINTQCLFSPN